MNYLYVNPHVARWLNVITVSYLNIKDPTGVTGDIYLICRRKTHWTKHFDISGRCEIEPNMMDIFDLVSRLRGHSTSIYP